MGRLRGYLPNRWPSWFEPRLVDIQPESADAFARAYPLTKSEDIQLLATPGHTEGHLSVLVEDGDLSYFLAGDASYTEQTMLDGIVDGVSLDVGTAQQTLDRIQRRVQHVPTVYLPSHDPDSAQRLADKSVVPTRAARRWAQPDARSEKVRQGGYLRERTAH
jgi:glyoxylase-like metal-dependent hydrolase (beta-lactamase superfamily II)